MPTPQTSNRETALQLINALPENRLPYVIDLLKGVRGGEEPPDDWDLRLLAQAEQENDGSTISLEELAGDLGVDL
mgnify:CR=1 FL=1